MEPVSDEILDSAHYDVSISHIGREVIGRTLQAPDRTYLQSYQASFGQCNALNTPAPQRSTSLSGVWMQLYYFIVWAIWILILRDATTCVTVSCCIRKSSVTVSATTADTWEVLGQMNITHTLLAEVESMQWQELLLHPHNQCFNVTLTCYDLHIKSHTGHEWVIKTYIYWVSLMGETRRFIHQSFVVNQPSHKKLTSLALVVSASAKLKH